MAKYQKSKSSTFPARNGLIIEAPSGAWVSASLTCDQLKMVIR